MALSGITNLDDVQQISITSLRRRLQPRGNLRAYSLNYNAFKSTRGRRQAVRVPHNAIAAARQLVNPDLGVTANAASIGHEDIEWEQGASAAVTSYPLTYSFDRWELIANGIAPSVIADHAARQVAGYERAWDAAAIAKLKAADRWGAAGNQMSVTVASSPTAAQVEDLVQAALTISGQYWQRGMEINASDSDGSAQRRIINVVNYAVVTAIMQEYFDSVAIGRALNDAPYLQATLGPILGGTSIVISRAMDNTITSAGDEYAFGTFLLGSLADVDDDSPPVNDPAYTAAGDPTLEQRVGFFRDYGIKHLDPLECYAVKMAVT